MEKIPENLLTYAETARQLSCSVRTVYKIIERGQIKPVYVTEWCPRIRKMDLMAFIKDCQQPRNLKPTKKAA